MIRWLRRLHTFLGVFFSPLLLLFVITGWWQTVSPNRNKGLDNVYIGGGHLGSGLPSLLERRCKEGNQIAGDNPIRSVARFEFCPMNAPQDNLLFHAHRDLNL